jgi:alpha-beta hydrolase superfamily lysophospholipase
MPLNPERITKSDGIMGTIMTDPLIYKGRISLGTANFMLDCVDTAKKNSSNIKTPFYILHGKEDRFALFDGSSKFYERAGIADKAIISVNGRFFK